MENQERLRDTHQASARAVMYTHINLPLSESVPTECIEESQPALDEPGNFSTHPLQNEFFQECPRDACKLQQQALQEAKADIKLLYQELKHLNELVFYQQQRVELLETTWLAEFSARPSLSQTSARTSIEGKAECDHAAVASAWARDCDAFSAVYSSLLLAVEAKATSYAHALERVIVKVRPLALAHKAQAEQLSASNKTMQRLQERIEGLQEELAQNAIRQPEDPPHVNENRLQVEHQAGIYLVHPSKAAKALKEENLWLKGQLRKITQERDQAVSINETLASELAQLDKLNQALQVQTQQLKAEAKTKEALISQQKADAAVLLNKLQELRSPGQDEV